MGISKRCNQTCLEKGPAADLQGIVFCQSFSAPVVRAFKVMLFGSILYLMMFMFNDVHLSVADFEDVAFQIARARCFSLELK